MLNYNILNQQACNIEQQKSGMCCLQSIATMGASLCGKARGSEGGRRKNEQEGRRSVFSSVPSMRAAKTVDTNLL